MAVGARRVGQADEPRDAGADHDGQAELKVAELGLPRAGLEREVGTEGAREPTKLHVGRRQQLLIVIPPKSEHAGMATSSC